MKPITIDFSDHEAATTLFNEAFQHPRRRYIVRPVDSEIAARWLSENTWMTNFTWCAGVKSFERRLEEVGALHHRQIISLDELYYRDRCGWAAGSYHCDYPDDGEDAEMCRDKGCEECEELGQDEQEGQRHKRLCYSFNCPIASEADREDVRKLYPALYQSDYKPYPDEEPHDWMVLHSRPRYAYVPNVQVIGCEETTRRL